MVAFDQGADTLDGGEGDDILSGGGGNDLLDGGDGIDVAQFTGTHNDYTIKANADGSITITDNRPGSPDGTDTIKNVERLQFANGIMRVIDSDADRAFQGDGEALGRCGERSSCLCKTA